MSASMRWNRYTIEPEMAECRFLRGKRTGTHMNIKQPGLLGGDWKLPRKWNFTRKTGKVMGEMPDEGKVRPKRKLKVVRSPGEGQPDGCRIERSNQVCQRLSPEKKQELQQLQDNWIQKLSCVGEDGSPGEGKGADIDGTAQEEAASGTEHERRISPELGDELESLIRCEMDTYIEKIRQVLDEETSAFKKRIELIARKAVGRAVEDTNENDKEREKKE